jgi:hypothetical protein
MSMPEKDDRTNDQRSNANQCEKGKLRQTVVKIVKGAAFVAGVVRPVVSNLAKNYPKLSPVSEVMDSVEAGLREAEEHVNKSGGTDGTQVEG